MRLFNKLLLVGFAIILGFYLTSCDNQVNSLDNAESSDYSSFTLEKPGDMPGTYPMFGSDFSYYWAGKDIYKGTAINIPNGSNFSISNGALTPPPGTVPGSDVEITMLVEKDTVKNQLIFTFGPHGSTFNPPAEVIFDYSDLGISEASLYYIDENGNYIPQTPASISVKNNKMLIYIDHFSRYAIGTE